MLSWVFPYLSVFICFDLLSAVPQASDFDAKLYQISENTQQICNKFAPKTSNIRKSKNKKEISVIRYISVILLHFCFFLLDLLSFVFAYTIIGFNQKADSGFDSNVRFFIFHFLRIDQERLIVHL